MDRNPKTCLVLAFITAVSLFLVGCESSAQTGAAVGAATGAGMGQMIGRNAESTLIGAAVGGGAGYMLGNEEDKKVARAETARIRDEMNYVAVNITNSNGSISQVRLRRQGVGYVGTRSEYILPCRLRISSGRFTVSDNGVVRMNAY